MLDKRKLKRRHLIYYLRVLEQETENLIGFVVDITTKGLMVMSEKPIETDRVFHCKMLVQSDMSEEESLTFDAKSKWSKKSINTDFYDTGFELLNISPGDFQDIEKIIEELGFRE